ncbi:hypothetical protein AOLI_G00310700 [Acnodon oligacanthus]
MFAQATPHTSEIKAKIAGFHHVPVAPFGQPGGPLKVISGLLAASQATRVLKTADHRRKPKEINELEIFMDEWSKIPLQVVSSKSAHILTSGDSIKY